MPLIVAKPPCSSGYVERIRPPGAPMSGLSPSSASTPYELNDEIRPPVGFGNVPVVFVHVIVAGPAAILPSINTPSVSETATTGIVIGIGPATVGLNRPGTLL